MSGKKIIAALKSAKRGEGKYYELIHPGAPGGVVKARVKMARRKQDKRAKPIEMYAVIFFPKITNIGPACIWPTFVQAAANSPEAALAKHMDAIWKGEKWTTYHHAGWRVRRIKIIDLGDA